MQDFTYIPYYSLKPNSLTLFQRPDKNFFSTRQLETFENLKDNENHYNELSVHSRKRLKNQLDYLLFISKNKLITGSKLISKKISDEIEIEKGSTYQNSVNYKLTFITLTISSQQDRSDEAIKSELLNHFFTECRKKFNMQFYIWKAEKQENGNIHFHILTTIFVNHIDLRAIWNRIQNKQGFNYVDKYSLKMQEFFKAGFRSFENDTRSLETQKKAYFINKSCDWTNPNSTDIHSLYKIRNISAYMTKYLSKGVTKTDRLMRMQFLSSEIFNLQEKNKELDKISLWDSFKTTEIEKNNLLIIDYLTEFKELKDKGVSGRIWGQSQKMSKLKNFVDCENWDNVPDIKQVQKIKEFEKFLEIGNSQLITYKFDINKTPGLKSIIENHIKACLSSNSNINF